MSVHLFRSSIMLLILAVIQSSVAHANSPNQPSFACFEHFTGRSYPVCPQYYGPTNCTDKFECYEFCRFWLIAMVVLMNDAIVMWEGRIAHRDIIHAMYKFRIQICHRHNQSKIKVLVLTIITICVMPTLLVMNMILHQLKVNIPNHWVVIVISGFGEHMLVGLYCFGM